MFNMSDPSGKVMMFDAHSLLAEGHDGQLTEYESADLGSWHYDVVDKRHHCKANHLYADGSVNSNEDVSSYALIPEIPIPEEIVSRPPSPTKNPEAEEITKDDIIPNGGTVYIDKPFVGTFEVLAAAISAGGSYDIPVTTEIYVNADGRSNIYGDGHDVMDSNLNDPMSDDEYSYDTTAYLDGGTIDVEAQSWRKRALEVLGTLQVTGVKV